MHRLFTIQDVVNAVFSWLPLSDLSVVARISSMWALPSLWADITLADGFSPLGVQRTSLGLRIGSVCNKSTLREHSLHQELPEEPALDQWARFRIYASHVRTIEVFSKDLFFTAGGHIFLHEYPSISLSQHSISTSGRQLC